MRVATVADSDALTSLYLRSRRAGLPWLATVHSEVSTRAWLEHIVVAEQHVIVVEDREGDEPALLGFAALHENWLQQLWVDPVVQGRGHGRRLLEAAKEHSPTGLHLHVFTRNTRARTFYEREGFVQTGSGDGSGNEEGEPDLTYSWFPPAADAPVPAASALPPVRPRPPT